MEPETEADGGPPRAPCCLGGTHTETRGAGPRPPPLGPSGQTVPAEMTGPSPAFASHPQPSWTASVGSGETEPTHSHRASSQGDGDAPPHPSAPRSSHGRGWAEGTAWAQGDRRRTDASPGEHGRTVSGHNAPQCGCHLHLPDRSAERTALDTSAAMPICTKGARKATQGCSFARRAQRESAGA